MQKYVEYIEEIGYDKITEIEDSLASKALDEIIELAEAYNYKPDYIEYKGNYIKKFDKNYVV